MKLVNGRGLLSTGIVVSFIQIRRRRNLRQKPNQCAVIGSLGPSSDTSMMPFALASQSMPTDLLIVSIVRTHTPFVWKCPTNACTGFLWGSIPKTEGCRTPMQIKSTQSNRMQLITPLTWLTWAASPYLDIVKHAPTIT